MIHHLNGKKNFLFRQRMFCLILDINFVWDYKMLFHFDDVLDCVNKSFSRNKQSKKNHFKILIVALSL